MELKDTWHRAEPEAFAEALKAFPHWLAQEESLKSDYSGEGFSSNEKKVAEFPSVNPTLYR